MRRWVNLGLFTLGVLLIVTFGTSLFLSRAQAIDLITHPRAARGSLEESPGDYGLPFEEVTVTTTDGFRLVGWMIPSQNGAAVMAQHGYKGNRTGLLEEAVMLHRNGYGVLLTTIRAHDESEGELISFGALEMQDLEAWYQYLVTRSDVDPARIGILGNSLGGSLVIQYAAQNEAIRGVVAHSAFSSIDDTVTTSIEYFTNLPSFPFAPFIVFWAEQEVGFDSAVISAKNWIGEISPRPVLILHGGQDILISKESGQLLYEAAGAPKELWYEPDLGHVSFDTELPEEFENRVVGFFDEVLTR
jgi:fermentation-respiration switch protein FrsA (DUF1100 family)